MTTPPEVLREALATLDRLARAHADALVAHLQDPTGEGQDAALASYRRLEDAAKVLASLP